jgi:uncharacterized protein YdeI (YjbR/CyaY-like superfamily)
MQYSELWAEELNIISGIISKLPFTKTIKWGGEVFTFNNKNVVSYGGFKNHFALWFYNGVFMTDKYNVLVNAQEGKTKAMRQWRFSGKNEIDENKILEYLEEAIDIEKKGLKIEPEKFNPLPLPDMLMNAINDNPKLKLGFEKLTPGKQKEYIAFMNEAKQDKTRKNRLEKIKPLILNGIGLNDKYKSHDL